MDDEQLLKLECLKMARETGYHGSELTVEAQRLFDFLKGRNQNKDGDRTFKDYKPE